MMMENIKDIEWHEPRIAVPAFVTMAIMPLTYSIAYGVLGGLGTYLVLHLCLTAIDLLVSVVKGEQLCAAGLCAAGLVCCRAVCCREGSVSGAATAGSGAAAAPGLFSPCCCVHACLAVFI
jgi:hypothetical protein